MTHEQETLQEIYNLCSHQRNKDGQTGTLANMICKKIEDYKKIVLTQLLTMLILSVDCNDTPILVGKHILSLRYICCCRRKCRTFSQGADELLSQIKVDSDRRTAVPISCLPQLRQIVLVAEMPRGNVKAIRQQKRHTVIYYIMSSLLKLYQKDQLYGGKKKAYDEPLFPYLPLIDR